MGFESDAGQGGPNNGPLRAPFLFSGRKEGEGGRESCKVNLCVQHHRMRVCMCVCMWMGGWVHMRASHEYNIT